MRLWLEVPELEEADLVFLAEGDVERTAGLDPDAPNGVLVISWTGVPVADEIDELGIRSASGVTLAIGRHDMGFAEPEVPVDAKGTQDTSSPRPVALNGLRGRG